MPTPRVAILSMVVLSLALLVPSPARAAKRTRTLADQYVQACGFDPKVIREVDAGPAFRPVKRLCVPVLPQNVGTFCQVFSKGNKALHWFDDGQTHIAMGLRPAAADGKPIDCYLWGVNYNGIDPCWTGQPQNDCRPYYAVHQPNGGRLLGVDLSEKVGKVDPTTYLGDFLEKVRTTGQFPDPVSGQNMTQGNCMTWCSKVEVAPGLALFHYLGIKRSIKGDGPNMRAKMCWSANDKVVVGVHVNSIDDFVKMSADDLLKRRPAAGVDDSARR